MSAEVTANKYRGPYKYKGKRWFVFYDWQIGFENGKPKYKRFQNSGNIARLKTAREKTKELNRIFRETKEKLENGFDPVRRFTPKLGELKGALTMAIDLKEAEGSRPETIRDYEAAAKRLLDYFGNCDPTRITTRELRQFLIASYENNTSRNALKGWAASLFSVMVEEEILADNPFKKIKRFRQEVKRKNRPFSSKDLKRIYEHIKKEDPKMILPFQLIYFQLIRRTEMTRLKREDFQNGKIFVTPSSAKTRTKKAIPWFDHVKIPDIPPNHYILGQRFRPGLRPLNPGSLTVRFTAILKSLEIEGNFYSLKGTGVKDMLNAGTNPYAVLQLGRWSSFKEMATYCQSFGIDLDPKEFKFTLS